MEKKLFRLLFFCSFYGAFSQIFAENSLYWHNETTPPSIYCDAPAPANFQVTSRGADFIAVAWDSISANVTYSMEVSVRENEAWVLLYTFSQIQETSLVIEAIEFDDEVLLNLATECSSGERSIYQTELKPKIILELTVPGRIPLSPQVFPACKNINLDEHEWIGFSVKKHGGALLESNVFEVVVSGDQKNALIEVKRNSNQTVIYAAKDNNDIPPPTLQAPNPFKIIDYSNPILPYDIGKVGIAVSYFPKRSVSICPTLDPVWDATYGFNVLVADLIYQPNSDPKEHSSEIEPCETNNKLKAISPFSETLHVFMECLGQTEENTIICLLNIAGQKISEHQITTSVKQFFIATDAIPSGIYALQFKTGNNIQTIKVFKVDF